MDKDLGSDLGPLGGGLGQFWVLTLTSWCREELSSPGLQLLGSWAGQTGSGVLWFGGGEESLAVGLVPPSLHAASLGYIPWHRREKSRVCSVGDG